MESGSGQALSCPAEQLRSASEDLSSNGDSVPQAVLALPGQWLLLSALGLRSAALAEAATDAQERVLGPAPHTRPAKPCHHSSVLQLTHLLAEEMSNEKRLEMEGPAGERHAGGVVLKVARSAGRENRLQDQREHLGP